MSFFGEKTIGKLKAMPGQLLESELFGHRKGSFTDARTHHRRLFLEADGGHPVPWRGRRDTHHPLALQPKLLRILEERCVRPVGSTYHRTSC
ncbi:MAG: sigma 54-interacting transcriptional regulator [Desulfofustis sp.]|nr:sigma 54-interacting transcriptional regulator [Desulfofustis sp.]